jgi:hypothetical protein
MIPPTCSRMFSFEIALAHDKAATIAAVINLGAIG